DDFVIQLSSQSDQIVLARTPPGTTLNEIVATAKQRMAQGESARPELDDEETLIVPKLALNVLREYGELRGKVITNFVRGGDPHLIKEANQSVRFLLNERGARVESETAFSAMLMNGHTKPPAPPKVRKFILDKPFLLMIKEPSATEPYLVVW